MMKPSALLPSVHEFLMDCGLEKTARCLEKEATLKKKSKVPLLEAAVEWRERKKRKKSESPQQQQEVNIEDWQPKPLEIVKVEEPKPFCRVDETKWLSNLDVKLKDNSYAGTFEDAGYGAKASDKLIKVKGKDFRAGKTKMKRKNSWGGGTIDENKSHSIKFD